MDMLDIYVEQLPAEMTPSQNMELFDAFVDFCHLPESQKVWLTFAGDIGRERNTRAGYFRKDAKDNKEVFQFTDTLASVLEDMPMPYETRKFMDMASEAHAIALKGLRTHLAQLNEIYESTHFTPDGKNNHHSRFVMYDKKTAGEVIAGEHYDQSTFTIAHCESAPGLQIGSSSENIADYIRDPNERVLFMGRGIINLHKMLGIPLNSLPAWHRVVQPPTDNYPEPRVAWITFANATYLDTTPRKTETAQVLTNEEITLLQSEGVLA